MNFNTLLKELNFPEGPVFDHSGNLWFVEIKGGNLSCWDGQNLERFDVGGTPNGAMVDREGNIWFCDSERGEIRIFKPVQNSFETVCNSTLDGKRLIRPNDLIFDNQGNLLFSDHADGRQEPIATICVLPAGGHQAKVISKNKYFTNGLALGGDGKTLVFSETYRQQLWKASWDSLKLELHHERIFAKTGGAPQGPDGIAFDENENLFVTVFNDRRVNIYSPQGVLLDSMQTRGNRPTSCAFDPSGKRGLVVTEAEHGEILSFPDFGKGLPIFYG
ncbi:MAG: SMP-30/gluconolactonase/LRE family protein [Bacteroidota bacterium]|nr:SMP-30/gluconolactonase/LRE family protein [Bacteroidota bacterium]